MNDKEFENLWKEFTAGAKAPPEEPSAAERIEKEKQKAQRELTDALKAIIRFGFVPVAEALAAHRDELVEAGWSLDAAEEMCLDIHSHIAPQILAAVLGGGRR